MAGTSLNHRLGCGADALANPNRITLSDLHQLHERVANGYLGGYRNTFYDLMLEALSGLAIDTLINTEAAALRLWTETGVRVLPGAYLSREVDGVNPGKGYVRVALVTDKNEMQPALNALKRCLYD